jgi:hypothetical protein
MPEQISKYPEVTVQVLQGAGARCGANVEKKILKQCPSEQFCSFKSGEICAYGLNQIPQMTQVTTAELARVVCPSASNAAAVTPAEAGGLVVTFAAGIALGAFVRRSRPR